MHEPSKKFTKNTKKHMMSKNISTYRELEEDEDPKTTHQKISFVQTLVVFDDVDFIAIDVDKKHTSLENNCIPDIFI
jgi:hypothetical protein